MFAGWWLLALFGACSAAVHAATGGSGLTLTPAQVLLPSTSYYVDAGAREPLKVHVQVLLRVEPRVCVNWEVQNPELLRLFPPNNEENYIEYSIVPLSSFGEGCSSSIWAASLPSALRAQSSESGAPLRSWVFAYEASTKTRAGAEVVISPMRSIQFETRNRRISVNQVATLKIVGHDEFANTFTSLEGIPFEAQIEDPRIMEIIDLRHDPEVATRARVSLLDKRDRFAVSQGSTLTSDVIVLQGRTVGRTRISVRVMLPEYREIVLKDVEFTVSDSIDLEPGRLVLPPGAQFKFCVQKIKPQSQIDDTWDPTVDLTNYQWSVAGGAGQLVKPDGTLTTGKAGGVDFRVILTDRRNSETFVSDISVRVPQSLGLSYGGLQQMLDCYATKGVDIADTSNLPHNSLLAQLQQQVYAGCRGGMRCGLRYLAAAAGATPPAYLLLGRSYVFDVGMRDKDDTAIYVAEGYSFSWRVENAAIVGVTRSPNGRFVVITALAEGVTKVAVELAAPRVSIEFTVSVTDPVHLLGFPVETIDVPNQQGLQQVPRSEPLVGSTRPLVVPLNENAKLVARGGSGEYLWHVDDIGMCSTKQGVLRCKAYGSTVLTVSDRLNPENVFKVQVVVQRMKRLELLPAQVHVEVGATAQFRLSAFADLADLAPVFSKSWGTASGEVGRFYSCMPLTYQVESAANAKLNCRVEHDRFMLDLTKVTEEPFSCGVFAYRTLHPGESEVSVSLLHEESMVMTELTASAKALIYDRLSLSVHPEYSQFPLKTPPQPFMNVSQAMADQSVFANVPIGGKVRLVVRGGPPMLANGLVVSTCNRSSAHLYVDKVDNAREGIVSGRTMFDVYCVAETAGDKVCVRVDGVLRNEYTISCRLPSYVEIHPLVSANNQTVRDNLLHCSGYPANWEDGDAVPTGVFSSGSNLCYKDESKTKWQIKTNADAMHAFRAVVFDAFGTPLCPSHSYKVHWSGSAAAGAAKSAELPFQKIDGSMFVYESTTLADSDIVADLEWPDALDPRHTSAGAAAVLKPKSVTTQIAASKMWTKSTSRRGGYLLSTSLRVQPTLPHEILIGASRTSLTPAEKRVSIFFNPRMRYQFAVALGSGNYVELTAYSESIKLQHSTTLTFSSAAEFAKLAAVVDGVTNLSDPLDLQKSVARYANTAMPPIPVKYLNFTCPQPCSRSLDIVDRSQLGQQTKTLIISQSPVSKLHIMITDIPDVENGVFEDLDVLSSLGGGINLLSVKRLYRVHAVALDGDGVPMSYASLSGLKFSVCSSNLVKLEHPKDVGFKAIGGVMVIQCLAEGKYTVRAEIRNFTGTTETPDGVLVSDSLEITAYRETSPVLASILMMPNSGEFHLSMLDGALSRSIPLQTAALETSDETVLQVVTSGQVGVIRAVKPGTCTMTSYIAGGTSSPSKSVTPVTVAMPYSVAVSGPSQILNGKSVVLYAKVSDYGGRPFTPIFVLGSSESATSSYCAFTWSVSGHGVFLEEGERTATVSGAGRARVTMIATSAGAITVALRASCRNLSASGTLELVAPKFAVESLVPSSVFGSHFSDPIILSPNSTYESLVGVVEPIASSDVGLLTVDGTSGQTTLKTESKTGHVLLKTADSYVTHVQVHEVNQLHVHSYGVQSSEISVLKSGKKELTVQLKTRDGRRILPPVDLRLKYMLSNSSLFRVTLSGHSIHVAANSADGCSSLMVLLDENDEQFTGTNMVVDTIRLCVVNALTPQDALVLKGSTVRFLAGDSRTFSVQMRGAPLAHAYTSMEHQDTLQYYQDAILSRMDALMSDLKSDLSRGLINVFRDIGLEESGCVDSLEMHQPYLEASQYVNGLKPLYVFPFSICREVDSATFTAKLTAFLQELGRSADSVFSMMEGGVSAISDNATSGTGVMGMLPSTKSGQNATSGEGVNAAQPSAVTGNWTVDEPDILSVSDSQGVALAAGSTVVKYSSEYMKGDSRITVFEAVTKVEYQHLADSAVRANATNMKPVFGTTIAYKEFYEPFYVVFKAATAGGSYLHNTLQVDSRVFAVCELVSKETWVKEVFGSEATYVVGSSATEFLPACRISIRSFGGKTEWNKMRNVLKGASESAYGLKLKVALYSTLPSDHKPPALTPSKQQSKKSTATDAAAAQPLWVSLRKVDALLSEQSFDWKLPVFAQFVDSVGIAISDVSVEPGKAVAISVYPHYSRCKLRVDGSHYKLRITEHQGLLCSFALENDGIVEPSSVQLVCQRTVAATLKISHPSVARLEVPTSVVTTEVRTTYGVDWMLIVFTACLAAGLAYLIYTLLHRPDIRYYETTEPIKIERRLPNVFEKLYQTDYHGSTSSTSVQYQHRRRL
ncbi:membrane protein, putative [Babesia bigemina]|uniref:Membrane protein, putative n=1 Tax=Babesia bigemina TaxID=5866 RepID=A0A061D6D9_BABBI|nr:membrane protein, putative [Babesia bigemina]CDR95582.1 membrane protein, putative [Babesia bigemina]|eukprot:XP_012767768.1 membrane protein, putative [Babesia bigemina]